VEGGDEYADIARELGLFLRRWHRLQDKRAENAGLDRAAFMLLFRLMGEGPARLSRLAGDMCVDLSVASRQMAALEAAGLVRRTPDPADRRASVIEVTDAGIEMFHRKRDRSVAFLRALLADWTEADRAAFVRLMGRLNGALAAHEEGK
jgi:DNA-binding MarR family transcriptional regulator